MQEACDGKRLVWKCRRCQGLLRAGLRRIGCWKWLGWWWKGNEQHTEVRPNKVKLEGEKGKILATGEPNQPWVRTKSRDMGRGRGRAGGKDTGGGRRPRVQTKGILAFLSKQRSGYSSRGSLKASGKTAGHG